MILELHNSLGNPQRIEATRIVIRDPQHGVLAVAIEVAPHHHYIVHRGDGDAAVMRALKHLGVNETVVSLPVENVPTPSGKLWQPGQNA